MREGFERSFIYVLLRLRSALCYAAVMLVLSQ